MNDLGKWTVHIEALIKRGWTESNEIAEGIKLPFWETTFVVIA